MRDEALRQRFDRGRMAVRAQACRCSVPDDCRVLDATKVEPKPVDACRAVPEAEHRHD